MGKSATTDTRKTGNSRLNKRNKNHSKKNTNNSHNNRHGGSEIIPSSEIGKEQKDQRESFISGKWVIFITSLALACLSVIFAKGQSLVIDTETYEDNYYTTLKKEIDSEAEAISKLILNTIFPHWEKNSATSSSHIDQTKTFQPLLLENDNGPSTNWLSHLIKIDDVFTILSNPALVHGTDYKMLKLTVRDGEEWSGILPRAPSFEQIWLLLNQRSFSVVINDVGNRWKPIQNLARSLELETGAQAVSTNLYLTPPGAARAFETHMDWMDVIVMQIVGEKDWSVWKKPFVKLLPPDLKRKPTMKELGGSLFGNVRLGPGNILYLPRGVLHNATTPLESRELSLHVTFGIEHDVHSVIESLLHYALIIFNKDTGKGEEVVIPKGMCRVNEITLGDLLHFSISEVVRMTNCGGFSEGIFQVRNRHNEAICSLRESVLLNPQVKKSAGRSDTEVEKKFISGAKAISSQVSAENALKFISIATSNEDNEIAALGSAKYTYPGMKRNVSYECRFGPKYNNDLSIVQKKLQLFADSFAKFTKRAFKDSHKRLRDDVNRARTLRWKNEDNVMNSNNY